MANKIYSYCSKFPAVSAISGNYEALRRFVKIKALDFGICNDEDIQSCLNEETINAVINMLRQN